MGEERQLRRNPRLWRRLNLHTYLHCPRPPAGIRRSDSRSTPTATSSSLDDYKSLATSGDNRTHWRSRRGPGQGHLEQLEALAESLLAGSRGRSCLKNSFVRRKSASRSKSRSAGPTSPGDSLALIAFRLRRARTSVTWCTAGAACILVLTSCAGLPTGRRIDDGPAVQHSLSEALGIQLKLAPPVRMPIGMTNQAFSYYGATRGEFVLAVRI